MAIKQEQLDQAIIKHEVPVIASVFPLNHFGIGRGGTVYLNERGQSKMETQRKEKWTEEEALEWAIPE